MSTSFYIVRYIYLLKYILKNFLLVCVIIREILNILFREFGKEPQSYQPKVTIIAF